MRKSHSFNLKAGITFLLFKSVLLTAQLAYNSPTNALSGNYTSGVYTYCDYNVHMNNFHVSNTANYTVRAGNSIKIGQGNLSGQECTFTSAGGAIFRAYVDPNYNLNGCNNVTSNLVWDNYYTGDGSIVRYAKPLDHQFYPRKSNNKGDVFIAATTNGISSISIKVTKNPFSGSPSNTYYSPTITNNHFSATIQINSELSEYKFEYQLNGSGPYTLIADNVVCGDAYFISGQSNAETGDLSQSEVNNLNNIYGTLGNNPYAKYGRSFGGTYSYNSPWGVAHTNLGNLKHVGAWGLVIQNKIMETYNIPVCIINGAIGGTAISHHLPEPNKDFYNPITNPTNTNKYFAYSNSRIYHAGLENDLKGILWWQGDANGGQATTTSYISQFNPLYNLWNQYYPNFAKGYIVQIPSWIDPGNEANLRLGSDEQRMLPAYFSKMKVMSANGINNHRNDQPEDDCLKHKDSYNDNCGNLGHLTNLYPNNPDPNFYHSIGNEIHHNDQGYIEVGNRLFRLIEVDFYGKITDINDIYPPNIQYATISGNQVSLHFDQNLSTTNSDDLDNVLSAVQVYGLSASYNLNSPSIDGNSFRFYITGPNTNVTHVSYLGFIPNKDCQLPNQIFDADFPCYLRNSKNVGALSFHNISIGLPKESLSTKLVANKKNTSFNIYPNPNNGLFTIQFEGTGEKEINVSDILGRTVRTFETKSLNLEMDLLDLKKGIYFIKVKSQTDEITKKVIID